MLFMSLSCASKSAFKSLISGTGEKSTLIMSVGVSVHTNYESVCLSGYTIDACGWVSLCTVYSKTYQTLT